MVEHTGTRGLALPFDLGSVAVVALGFALAAGPAAHRGGYFAGTWSWLVLAACFIITVRLITSPTVTLGRLDLVLLAALAAFTGWVALSSLWAPALTPALDELVRLLTYLSVVLLTLLVVRRTTVEPLLVGVLAGIVAVSGYALATRLAPDRVGSWDPDTGYRLADPIGYWNGLGIYAAMGALLAVGLVAGSRSRLVRAFAGATPPALLATVFLTFSRGAWLALAVAFLLAFALDPRRLRLAAVLLVLAPWPAVVLLAAVRSDTLTDTDATLAQLVEAGESFGWLVAVMTGLSAITAVAFGELADRVDVPVGVRRGFAGVLIGLALAGVVVFWSAEGSPWTAAERAWDRFTSAPNATGSDATERLFDLSANGRIELWRVSWHDFEEQPVAGLGAGSFASEWFANRDIGLYSREGHSLYAETLGELGLVGLVLLGCALAVPLVAAVRGRRHRLVVAAFAPYCAFLVHAGVDWDWELAGVTLPALVAGAAIVGLGRDERSVAAGSRRVRVALAGAAAALTLIGIALVMANVSLDRAREDNREGRWARALASADRAVRWAPWSASAREQQGRALLGLGRVAQARAAFREAVDRNPYDHELWVGYASALEGRAALAAIDRAISLNPRDPELAEQRRLYARRAAVG